MKPAAEIPADFPRAMFGRPLTWVLDRFVKTGAPYWRGEYHQGSLLLDLVEGPEHRTRWMSTASHLGHTVAAVGDEPAAAIVALRAKLVAGAVLAEMLGVVPMTEAVKDALSALHTVAVR